jgi:hypothetical protein
MFKAAIHQPGTCGIEELGELTRSGGMGYPMAAHLNVRAITR